ncbi:hypothetical protein HAX54_014469 [Datura stramonium]|uniref:Uncharacterized protein n=1 Tax=Datura stramonium TaxID=4076 RepID=A0ABS8RJB0_DATST|nr:hypothetical protein [Datura stramonium]
MAIALTSFSSLPLHSLHQQFPSSSKYFTLPPITVSLSEKPAATVTQLHKITDRKIPELWLAGDLVHGKTGSITFTIKGKTSSSTQEYRNTNLLYSEPICHRDPSFLPTLTLSFCLTARVFRSHDVSKELTEKLDKELAEKGKADLNSGNDQAAFNFLAKSLYGANPVETKLGTDAPTLIGKWVLFQLHPVVSLGLRGSERPYPPYSGYRRLWGGAPYPFSKRDPIRSKIRRREDHDVGNGENAVDEISSIRALQLIPGSFTIRKSQAQPHDRITTPFEVKKGEMLYGTNHLRQKDPKILLRPEDFVADRFVGERRESLLKHVLWSNGPETENPTVENKQCAGKDFVVLVSEIIVVTGSFLRYDTLDVDVRNVAVGS